MNCPQCGSALTKDESLPEFEQYLHDALYIRTAYWCAVCKDHYLINRKKSDGVLTP